MRFLDSGAIKETGYSTVIVEHKGNKYVGKAKCHPDDTFSNITGCRYAHIRAEIKALKDELHIEKNACEECRKFVAAIEQYAGFDKESSTARAMYRQLNRRIKRVNNIIDEINKKQLGLNLSISKQNSVHYKYHNKPKADNCN